MATLLRLEEITRTFPDGTHALRGVTLDVATGVTGLLGPNGAGKTTLMSIAVLAMEPTGGRREYFGVADDVALSSAIRRRIGYLPQAFSPIPDLTAREFLAYCANTRLRLSRSEVERRVDALLDAVALQAARDVLCRDLSGGMKRRIGIAQALIHSPSLLIVDEPTTGLDPTERVRFRELLAELAQYCAVLLSTHIAEDVEACAERIAILLQGRIAFAGSVAELLSRYAGRLALIERGAELPNLARILGTRVAPSGRAADLFLFDGSPTPRETMRAPSLEEAYTAFLVERRGSGGS